MYRIKTLNEISPIIGESLTPDLFAVGAAEENPSAIVVRSADMLGVELPDELLSIARAGAGYNNVPVDRCSEKGIVVFNTPGANANAVKELVLAGLVLASRDIVGGINWAQGLKGKGEDVPKLVEKGKGQFVGSELKGKKLGVLGLGAIGVPIANGAVSLDMEISGYDPAMSVASAWALSRSVHQAKSEEELISSSEYLTLHIPYMPKTKHWINAEKIAKMPQGAVLLNFSRGEIVDDQAVLEALAAGKLRAYVTDFPNDMLIGAKGVIAIPHLGASTLESEENCAQMAAEQTRDYLLTGEIRNSVNFPTLSMPRATPYRLCVAHKNVPAMISQITSFVGSAKINIANMINQSRGEIGYTVLDTETQPDEALITQLENIDGTIRVRVIA